MRAQFQIENSNVSKAREYNKLMPQLEIYRLFPNIDYIIGFIEQLYSVRSFKMIIKEEEIVHS